MKPKLLKIIAFFLIYNFSFSQPNDTLYGKIKSIREQLVFLDENHQNLKLFSTEGDYGHNGFLSEEYTKNRFKTWWYQTYWVHYINYYKEFDVNNRILKTVWYYKSSNVLNSTENKYDSIGNMVNQKLFSYKEENATHSYDKNNNLIYTKIIGSDKNYSTTSYEYTKQNKIFKEESYNSEYPKQLSKSEYYYDENSNLILQKHYDEFGEKYGTIYTYDKQNRKIKVVNHSPFIWVKHKKYSNQKRTKKGNDQISKEFIYDKKSRIIETKFYNSNFNDENKAELSSRQIKTYENDLIESIKFYDNKDSITYYKKYEYDNQYRKTKELSVSTKYPENNITLEYFYGETEYPIKLIYTEKNIPIIVEFEYVFDVRKNWIEQTKSVNGKKLYVWKREINYLE